MQVFGKALFLSQKLSIDSFLEHRPEFIEIGKIVIALFILGKEIDENLFAFENRDKGCYQYLFDKLNSSWEEFAENKVSFITFNYDRSLEQFFFTSLQNAYGKTDEECAKQLKGISIVHVHGLLGTLPWQTNKGIQYGANLNKRVGLGPKVPDTVNSSVITTSKQIKIVTEDQADSEEFKSAFKLLSEAERIYFLGFGYHSKNMERLGITNLPRIKELQLKFVNRHNAIIKNSPAKGTSRGMDDSEIQTTQKKWLLSLPNNNCDSLTFLRKYAELD